MHITFMNHCEPAHSAQLNERMMEAFGFTFQPWFERGQWDERYESHSIMESGRMLANVGVFQTGLLIDGQRFDTLQIGAVATAKDARRRGYQRAIFDHIFETHPGAPAFLHANASVTQFYPRLGFRRVWEWIPTVDASIDNVISPTKAGMDDPAFSAALRGRGPLSLALDCANNEPVQWFHLIFDYGEHIYLLPALNAYVLAVQQDEKLLLADVIAKQPISFSELSAQLPFRGVKRVEFGFTPDLLGVSPAWTRIDSDDEALFVRGELPLPERFRIPVTSIT